ncbi:hypothetical protein [Roseateles aquatilis]|nr:hypothetical protein [Roseateles aquatilis]
MHEFTPHLEAAKGLMSELAAFDLSAHSAREVLPGGHGPESRALFKHGLIKPAAELERQVPVHLQASRLPGGTIVMSVPGNLEALAWGTACVNNNIDRVLNLVPAEPKNPDPKAPAPLMSQKHVTSRDGTVAVDFECRRQVRLGHHDLPVERIHTVTMTQSGRSTRLDDPALSKGSARRVAVLDFPMFPEDRYIDPEGVQEALSLLPASTGGRLVIMAPALSDEVAVLAAAHDLAGYIDAQPSGKPLSDSDLDDRIVATCVGLRMNCHSALFQHADQLATLRSFAHARRADNKRLRLDEQRGEAPADWRDVPMPPSILRSPAHGRSAGRVGREGKVRMRSVADVQKSNPGEADRAALRKYSTRPVDLVGERPKLQPRPKPVVEQVPFDDSDQDD